MMDRSSIWIQYCWVLLLTLVTGDYVWAQEPEERSIQDMLRQCQRNIRINPVDGQSMCRHVIGKINIEIYPEQYKKKKIKAFRLLSESYFRVGRIADAEMHVDSVKALTGPNEVEEVDYQKSIEIMREIERLFRPLWIKIRNREIPRLAYVEGIDIEFRWPKNLEEAQIERLLRLQDKEGRSDDEFQFVWFGPDGQPYMEIDYFPVITSRDRSLYYSLIVNKKRRYRFSFTPRDDDETLTLEIDWPADASWELVEKVPEDKVKIVLPDKYSFTPQEDLAVGQYFISPDEMDPVKHIYLPANNDNRLKLLGSDDSAWEKTYRIALYTTTGIAMLMGLLGAR